MSAHILNMLKEFRDCDLSLDAVKHAIGFTFAGDALEFNDWQTIEHAQSIAEVKRIATLLVPKYERIWKLLDEPETAEQWQYIYFKGVKTTRKHAVRVARNEEVLKREWDSARNGYKLVD